MRRQLDKLKSRAGVTLAELLLAVLILGMLVSLVCAGTKAVERAYRSMSEMNECQILADEIVDIIADELRFAKILEAEDDYVYYWDNTKEEGRILGMETDDLDEEGGVLVVLSGGGGEDDKRYPYPEAFYGRFRIWRLNEGTPVFQWNPSGNCIEISFGISDEMGEMKASVDSVNVRILNR